MSTGLTVLMTENPQVGLRLILVPILYHGVPRSSPPSRSSTEAKYKAMDNATVELMWVRFILQELHIMSPQTAHLWCGNMDAKYLSSNLVFHGRMKHIEVDYHFIRDQVMKHLLDDHFILTNDQVADSFTKALPQHQLQEFYNNLNLGKL
jgi:inhibitor of KinA sporulation pathway (predicted exonuclease)